MNEEASAEPRVARALQNIRAMLVPGEQIEAWAIQRRLFALTHRRMIIIATTGRFIGIHRNVLGGFKPVDVRWQDIKEASLYVGTFGADVGVVAYDNADRVVESTPTRRLSFIGFRKQQAQQVYRNCQGYEQQWREKRRVRELEELRAQSGGVQIGAGITGGTTSATAGDDSVKRLQQAKEMLSAGLINDSEYEAIKARIINSV